MLAEPMDVLELERVYAVQVALGAVKRCETCGGSRPVSQFDGYGAQPCFDRVLVSMSPRTCPGCGYAIDGNRRECRSCHRRLRVA